MIQPTLYSEPTHACGCSFPEQNGPCGACTRPASRRPPPSAATARSTLPTRGQRRGPACWPAPHLLAVCSAASLASRSGASTRSTASTAGQEAQLLKLSSCNGDRARDRTRDRARDQAWLGRRLCRPYAHGLSVWGIYVHWLCEGRRHSPRQARGSAGCTPIVGFLV